MIFFLLRAFDNAALGMLRLFVLLSTENFPVSKLTSIIVFSSSQYTAVGKKLEFQLPIGQVYSVIGNMPGPLSIGLGESKVNCLAGTSKVIKILVKV